MPKRGTDPETIAQALTCLESRLVDRCSATEEKQARVVETTRVQLHLPSRLAGWPEWTLAADTGANPSI